MARDPARAKNRATRRRKTNTEAEAVIPVKVQNTPTDGRTMGTAEIPVALEGISDSAPGSVVGRAKIPVTISSLKPLRTIRNGARNRKAGARHPLTVVPLASNRKRKAQLKETEVRESREREERPLPPLPPLRRNPAEMNDPLVRTLKAAIDLEETAVNIAGSFTLAAIGAFETATRLLLSASAVVQWAREAGDAVVPWSLDEIEGAMEEWPGARFAA